MVGILSGAVTNTPGLGAAQQAYSDMTGISDETMIIWSRVFIRMIVPYWKTCKSGWGSSFITSLWNIGMTIVMWSIFASYSIPLPKK